MGFLNIAKTSIKRTVAKTLLKIDKHKLNALEREADELGEEFVSLFKAHFSMTDEDREKNLEQIHRVRQKVRLVVQKRDKLRQNNCVKQRDNDSNLPQQPQQPPSADSRPSSAGGLKQKPNPGKGLSRRP